jgi:hypothetical protein
MYSRACICMHTLSAGKKWIISNEEKEFNRKKKGK